MSVERVREYLGKFGRDNDVLIFDVSSATVELAALAVGVPEARIAKTLSFSSKDGDGCILIVTAGDARIDNPKYKHQFMCKARMLSLDEALAFTGHTVGGVCPFAIENDKVEIYLDESLKRFETVFPAAGSSNSAIELTLDDLFVIGAAKAWVDVCKGWQEGE